MNQHRRIVALAGLSGAALFAAWSTSATDEGAAETLAVVAGAPGAERLPTRTGAHETDVASPREISPVDLLQGIAALPADASWAPAQLVVRADSPEALLALAERFDARVAFGRHRTGTGVLQFASDDEMTAVRSTLADELGRSNVGRNGIIRGAAYGLPESPASLQWHLDAAEIRFGTAHSTRVAVLDSGVAYRTAAEAWSDQIGAFFPRRAPSLLTSPMVDPWDFVANDPFPDDEYWHGTHIASVLASSGQVKGAANAVRMLPYRVLDAENVGLESFLVDALLSAESAGAAVVNMSLSFGPSYVPSPMMLDTLDALAESGVVMVAAAGNQGRMGASWPAASRHVISVGASCGAGGAQAAAPYSNIGSDVDLLAPGGCLDRDDNYDGHPDGILGEAPSQGSPSDLGLYWVQGTSQATAVVSGVVARLLERGVPPNRMRDLLQLSAQALDHQPDDALNLGSLDYMAASRMVRYLVPPLPDYRVAMVPWIAQDGDALEPRVKVMVLDGDNQPVSGVWVHGHMTGSTDAAFRCLTEAGICEGVGAEITGRAAVGWSVTIGRVGDGVRGGAPRSVVLLNEAMDLAVSDIHVAYGELPPLGFELLPETFPDAIHAFSVVASGSGLATSPFGVVLTEAYLDDIGATIDDALSGTGLATSPFGVVGIDLPGQPSPGVLTVEGSGLATSPFGAISGPFGGDPPCVGLETCPVSVLDPAGGAVTGALAATSQASAVFGSGTAPVGIEGSAALMDSGEGMVEMQVQSQMRVPLIPN